MNFKENKGLILSIIGLILTLTIYGAIIGIPVLVIGIYFQHKKTKEYSQRKEELENQYQSKTEELENQYKSKKEEMNNIDETIARVKKETREQIETELKDKQEKIQTSNNELKQLRKELELHKDELHFQDYGLYEPRYDFVDSVSYKEKLIAVRKQQKRMIKDKIACTCKIEWEVGGSKAKGRKMMNDNIKLALKLFNLECENATMKVKHSNFDISVKRINNSFEKINKLNSTHHIVLSKSYLDLKIDELHIAYEYALKKEEEKELLKEAKEKEREEKKLQKELEKEKNKFIKENDEINNEINSIEEELKKAAEEEKAKLEAEILKLKEALNKNNEEITKINEWKEKPGAGYVYIISNIGSFGKDVFKIGVTRREKPEERIRELSSASVPFRYDTHVFIFSKDAYALENELHTRFDKQRVNKVNRRKEFFRISIDDIKQIVEENKGAVHSFVENAEAEEYYDTLRIEKKL